MGSKNEAKAAKLLEDLDAKIGQCAYSAAEIFAGHLRVSQFCSGVEERMEPDG